MSDWDDSWYDDDFAPTPNRRGRTGIVVLSVFTFIICGINALSSTCLLFCGMLTAAIDNGNGNFLPGDLMSHAWLILLVTGLASAFSFLMQIVAGIGLINGRRWARTLTLYLAGYSAIFSLFLVYLIAKTLTTEMGNAEDNIGYAILYFFGLAFHGAYAATAFIVLFDRRACSTLR